MNELTDFLKRFAITGLITCSARWELTNSALIVPAVVSSSTIYKIVATGEYALTLNHREQAY